MTLLNYNSYEEYLNNFITINDMRYLRNLKLTRKFIQNACGKSCMGCLLSPAEFAEQRKILEYMLKPRGISDSTLFGDAYKGNDEVLKQFAAREHKLLNKQISTIIFLVMRSKRGLEISGYIDLEQSFRESRYGGLKRNVKWPTIFEGKAKLMPKPSDLSYFDWYQNKVLNTDSDNFNVISAGAHSLLMKHRGDHKLICVNAGCDCGYIKNATRTIYNSGIYGHCMFFDHVIRRIN